MPKHTADLVHNFSAMKVYYDAKDWVSIEDYKNQLFAELKSLGKETVRNSDETHYTKCSEIPRYFGWLERKEPTKISSDVRITQSGIRIYEAYGAGRNDDILEEVISSLENITYGRNNQGCGSDSDVEPPCVMVKGMILLDGLSNREFAYLLAALHLDHKSFDQALIEVKSYRDKGVTIPECGVNSDIKFIKFLRELKFLEEAGNVTRVAQNVKVKYFDRLAKLHLFNKAQKESNAYDDCVPMPEIFYGAPGTGKTYAMNKEYHNISNPAHRFFVTFHQSYAYEEFIEGIKPETDKGNVIYKCFDGIFYKACDMASQLLVGKNLQEYIEAKEKNETLEGENDFKDKIVLFCIDEINRANISSVFGDLISLIEDTKRIGLENQLIVTLPYSKRKFGVPRNLKIIGTMNTADRSILVIDSALRRRFKFKEFLPNYEEISSEIAKKILDNLNSRIRVVLDKDHQIGHSYFMNIEKGSITEHLEVFNVLKSKIIPLLQEYFYNDNERIKYVLNEVDNVDNTQAFYVKDEDAMTAADLLPQSDRPEVIYMLNPMLDDVITESQANSFIDHLMQ